MALDIRKLIDVAEQAIDDPEKQFAASAQYPVQDFCQDGHEYRLSIVVTAMAEIRAQEARMKPYFGDD